MGQAEGNRVDLSGQRQFVDEGFDRVGIDAVAHASVSASPHTYFVDQGLRFIVGHVVVQVVEAINHERINAVLNKWGQCA